MGLAADGFEISMYFYVKVHFQKNFISENKVHCGLNRARTLTIRFHSDMSRLPIKELYFGVRSANDFVSSLASGK